MYGVLWLVCFVLGASGPIYAVDNYWDREPSTAGDWFVPVNWFIPMVPDADDTAYIDNTGVASIFQNDAVVSSLILGETANGTLLVSGGTLTSDFIVLGYGSGADGHVIHSDGDVSELIPLWLDVGINCPYPMEARCNDLMSYRKTYGQHLRMIGGVDKGRIALGRRSIDQFILRDTRDLVRLGGYIPHIDHAIPPSISFSDYKYYRNLLALISDEVGADRV